MMPLPVTFHSTIPLGATEWDQVRVPPPQNPNIWKWIVKDFVMFLYDEHKKLSACFPQIFFPPPNMHVVLAYWLFVQQSFEIQQHWKKRFATGPQTCDCCNILSHVIIIWMLGNWCAFMTSKVNEEVSMKSQVGATWCCT